MTFFQCVGLVLSAVEGNKGPCCRITYSYYCTILPVSLSFRIPVPSGLLQMKAHNREKALLPISQLSGDPLSSSNSFYSVTSESSSDRPSPSSSAKVFTVFVDVIQSAHMLVVTIITLHTVHCVYLNWKNIKHTITTKTSLSVNGQGHWPAEAWIFMSNRKLWTYWSNFVFKHTST